MSGLTKNSSLILKGVAIALIIISHVAGMYAIRYFTPLGGIGVALFLFLSGYGLSESVIKKDLKGFWVRRIFTVFLPYILIEIVVMIITNKFNIKDFVLSVLFIYPRQTQIWYLQYLLLNYFCFWCVYKFVDEKYRLICLLVLAIISVFILPEIAAEQALSFLCGCAFSKRKELFTKLGKNMVICLVIGCAALAIKQFEVVRSAPQIIKNLVQLMIKLPSAMFVIGFVIRTVSLLKYRCFECIGKISYELYLVHINLLFLITTEVLDLFIFVALTCFCAVNMHIVVNKVGKVLLHKNNAVTRDR